MGYETLTLDIAIKKVPNIIDYQTIPIMLSKCLKLSICLH